MKSSLRSHAQFGSGPLLHLALMFVLTIADSSFAADEKPKPDPAKIEVSGYGLLGNLDLKRTLQLLLVGDSREPLFSPTLVEDGVMILFSRLNRDGYLGPAITTTVTSENGKAVSQSWSRPTQHSLSREKKIRHVHFKIEPGVLFHFVQLQFEGLTLLAEKEARALFVEVSPLFSLRRHNIYTPDRLERGLANLVDLLERRGFQNARAEVSRLDRNDRTGAVSANIQVREGPKWMVRSVRKEIVYAQSVERIPSGLAYPMEPYSKAWEQDFAQSLRNEFYHAGYPDASVEITTAHREESEDTVRLDLVATVKAGPRVTLGEVKFEGQEKTKLSLLARRVRLDENEPLDRTAVERGRYRLVRLGIFETVDLAYEPVDETTRNVIYRLKEGKEIDLSLLFGYGSYELLRAGFELEQYNVWGRAHRSRLRAVQSFKSSTADYSYTMPELVGEDVDVIFNASGLRRKEISFTREEFGGGAGARKYFKAIESDVGIRYNYQVLTATEIDSDFEEGLQSAGVGAVISEITHDRRDNPLYPREGYKLFGQVELASEYLVGDANYQRIEMAGAYHQPLDGGRWLHLGLSHGAVFAVGARQEDLPFNKRFFPGGESSVRGYQQGEAAPRNERGRIVGAEVYFVGNVEFEQELSSSWSVVTFLDGVGFAREIAEYPFREALLSVGGGLRWKTLIGPIRLEYGYNLNRRARDPAGTLHFSIGFPF